MRKEDYYFSDIDTEWTTTIAVSYTHLDVYKRQPCVGLINCGSH